MAPHIHQSNSQEQFNQQVLSFLSSQYQLANHNSGVNFRIGLSGGSTPGPIYSALNNSSDFDLSKIDFFQIDERYISSESPKSNHHLISQTLSDAPNFHYFDTSLPIPECVHDYQDLLQKSFATSDHTLDVAILGVGPDGHTASLFPGSSALNEAVKLTAHTTTEVFDIYDRLTTTFPVIMESKTLVVLMKGAAKKEILDKFLHQDLTIDQCPAKKLLAHPALHIFFGNF